MYLFYMDESGNTGRDLDSTEQPIHWLVAFCVEDSAARRLEEQAAAIADDLLGSRASDPDFEFHGSEIFHGRGDFRGLSPDQRVELYDRLMSLLGDCSCRIFVRGIHKARHKRRAQLHGYTPEHPHKLAFMYLVERIDRWLEATQESEDDPAPCGLLVADEQREMDRVIVANFARWRRWGTDHGYLQRDIVHLIDTVHFVRSEDSWLIQLADCLAYLRSRYYPLLQLGWTGASLSRSQEAVKRLWEEHCRSLVEDVRVWPQQ